MSDETFFLRWDIIMENGNTMARPDVAAWMWRHKFDSRGKIFDWDSRENVTGRPAATITRQLLCIPTIFRATTNYILDGPYNFVLLKGRSIGFKPSSRNQIIRQIFDVRQTLNILGIVLKCLSLIKCERRWRMYRWTDDVPRSA